MNKKIGAMALISLLSAILVLSPSLVQASQAEERLMILLRDYPGVAERFLNKVTASSIEEPITLQQAKQPIPIPEPVSQPKPEPVSVHQEEPALGKESQTEPIKQPVIQPKPEPVEQKPWITKEEKILIDALFSGLESYCIRAYKGIAEFFNKANDQKYDLHIKGFQATLNYLQQEILAKFPQPLTPARKAIFDSFLQIAKTLEEGQRLLIKVANPKEPYSSSLIGVTKLANNYRQIMDPLATQKSIARHQISTLKKELNSPHMPGAIARLNKLQSSLNKIFDFGKNWSIGEIFAAVKHRLGTQ